MSIQPTSGATASPIGPGQRRVEPVEGTHGIAGSLPPKAHDMLSSSARRKFPTHDDTVTLSYPDAAPAPGQTFYGPDAKPFDL